MEIRFGGLYWPREVDKRSNTARRGEQRKREETREFRKERSGRTVTGMDNVRRPREVRRREGDRREEAQKGWRREQRKTEREINTNARRQEGGEGTPSRRTNIRVREEGRDKSQFWEVSEKLQRITDILERLTKRGRAF